MPTRVIDEHPSHHLRRHGEKVSAVLPGDGVLPCQTDISLMDECCGLECVVSPLASQLRRCSLSQFAVHNRHQVIYRPHVSLPPGLKQTTHVGVCGWHI